MLAALISGSSSGLIPCLGAKIIKWIQAHML